MLTMFIDKRQEKTIDIENKSNQT